MEETDDSDSLKVINECYNRKRKYLEDFNTLQSNTVTPLKQLLL